MRVLQGLRAEMLEELDVEAGEPWRFEQARRQYEALRGWLGMWAVAIDDGVAA